MTTPDPFTADLPIWDAVECLPRVDLKTLQLERLRSLVERIAKVPFYQQAFAAADITPGSLESLDDLRRLPITTKEDLRDAHPLGFLTVPRASLARIHGSSGTTGRPTFVAYTAADLDLWSGLVARLLVAGGLRSEHTVHIAFGYGLFTGGFGLHQGIERIGAAIVPAASGNTRRQIKLIQDLGAEVLVCTPSYALTIADTAREQGIDPRELPLRYAHLGGEPWTEDMRLAIEKEAMPLIRYRTRDIACLDPSPCACGRTSARMSRVQGRSDDMLIIRGVNVFPSQIEEALLHVKGTAPHYMIEVERPNTLDHVRVKVEMRPETFGGDSDRQQALHRRIVQEIHSVAGIRTEVELVAPGSLERFVGKAKRVIDRR